MRPPCRSLRADWIWGHGSAFSMPSSMDRGARGSSSRYWESNRHEGAMGGRLHGNGQFFLELLFVIKACIIAIASEQLLMPAELDNASMIEDGDLIRFPDGRHTMRDQDGGCSRRVGPKAAQNPLFRVGVDIGQGIIEDKDR